MSPKPEALTDHELYEEIKKLITRDEAGERHIARRLDGLRRECLRRDPEIFYTALRDAYTLTEALRLKQSGIASISRIKWMTPGEIAREINESTGRSSSIAEKLAVMLTEGRESCILIKVSGDSMTGAGINDGCLLVTDTGAEAATGDIVVAKVDGNSYVKRLIEKNGQITLVSENPDPEYRDFRVDEDCDFEIIGKVIKILNIGEVK
ncbi:MAG: LexA family protein [Candidatus Kapaibacterium sp.]